jgi:Zn-dependent peptidase ImmA (M78 family)
MFLLPEDAFRRDCNGLVKVSNPDAYLDIKQKWQISLQAIAIRAFKLNIIDYQQYRYFFMSINKKGYRQIEPLDHDIAINHPTKIMSILQLLFEKGFYSVSGLMDDLRVDQSFLTVLTGIPEDFFSKHLQNEDRKFTVDELGFKLNV